jgi:hemerythrin
MNIDHESYYTGIPLIDNQHEQYLRLVEDLFASCERSDFDQKIVDGGLTIAFAYAIEHFDAEEALMVSTGYRGYETHRKKHNEFRDEVDRVSAVSKEGIDPEDQLMHMTKWLLEWFLEQTLLHDTALAAFLKRDRSARGKA